MNKLMYSLLFGVSICTQALAEGSPANTIQHAEFKPSYSHAIDSQETKMSWFEDAKLGIFIHWGIYSVRGISESWGFFNNYINHENYMKQLDGFTAARYQPEDWVKLIEQSGAKYAVITSKHHDGVALWDSKAPQGITTAKDAQVHRDVLTPFVKALQKTNLKTGIYFSLPDWSHPLYDINTRTKKRYEVAEDPARWKSFVNFYQQQLKEISQQFKPDLLWFDGDWEHNEQEWKSPETMALLRSYNPQLIVNSRLNHYGDYETPEQGVPVVRPKSRYWELCYTMNDSWGYQPFDQHYKSPNMLIRTLVDCISMGGNLLLDISPKADGSIPEEQQVALKELGRWTSNYAEAIYGTRAGIPFANYAGKSALSKDGKTLYLYVEEHKNTLYLSGIQSSLKQVRLLGTGGKILQAAQLKGEQIKVDLGTANFDSQVSVVALTFQEPLRWQEPKSQPLQLAKILDTKEANPADALHRVVEDLHAGNNSFKEAGLTSDGMELKAPLAQAKNKAVVEWVSKHAEALYESSKGLPEGHYAGYSTLSKDRQTLYLFVEGKPTGPIALKGLKNSIARIRIVGEGSMLSHQIFNKLYWSPIPGIVYIDIPKDRLDKDITVIAVLLDKPVELYREDGGAIESNL